MPSPFPGMDPYLEPHWPDVHTKLVTYTADALADQLAADLIVRTEERVAIETDDDAASPRARFGPDVRVAELVGRPPASTPLSGASAVALAPLRLVAIRERTRERFVKVLDANGERLVTVIEFLGPANKRGRGLRAFRRKRAALLDGGVNVVEIDLVRAGDWRRLLRPHVVPAEARSVYRFATRVASDADDAVHFQPVPLRAPLPTLVIPLRDHEPPARVELQPLLERAYERGRYARTLNYSAETDPPLDPEDAAWAAERVRAVTDGTTR